MAFHEYSKKQKVALGVAIGLVLFEEKQEKRKWSKNCFHLPRKNGAGLQRSSNVCGNFPIAWVRSMENTYK
ncbi:unnamed protein product [Acanthoscelides obtectus]|uniref:Uncharacterized protein n=1 Tax=Acanthoscelides obtectus TaxID=200917 RepID=A0A9P0LFF9_ACAOB|nr:unnamed protein product [Acanthoscelides obtectus]CAK1627619.1 hypothetical protein AOBTE_LOCUS4711 [Acanthoscelides obtectus]